MQIVASYQKILACDMLYWHCGALCELGASWVLRAGWCELGVRATCCRGKSLPTILIISRRTSVLIDVSFSAFLTIVLNSDAYSDDPLPPLHMYPGSHCTIVLVAACM